MSITCWKYGTDRSLLLEVGQTAIGTLLPRHGALLLRDRTRAAVGNFSRRVIALREPELAMESMKLRFPPPLVTALNCLDGVGNFSQGVVGSAGPMIGRRE